MRKNIEFIFLFTVFYILVGQVLLAEVPINPTPNFSVSYEVQIKKKQLLRPKVIMKLRGADEVLEVTSILEKQRYKYFQGDGKFTQIGNDIVWIPGKMNATMTYEVDLLNLRKPKVYDSYGKDDWIITRTTDFFPRKNFTFRKAAKSYTLVKFILPEGWQVVSSMTEFEENTFLAREATDKRYEWPTGWLAIGKIEKESIDFGGVRVEVAYPEAFVRPSKSKKKKNREIRKRNIERFKKHFTQAINIYKNVVPRMVTFMPSCPKKFLVIMGESPMWRGGLSGEESLYINRLTPNIADDYSSTLIHEYFHVCQGFKKDKRDAEWFIEGLAEYFSMRLLYESGVTSLEDFSKGMDILKKESIWGVNLLRSKSEVVYYKNSPIVLFVLDEMIREGTLGQKSLKDVVRSLSGVKKRVNTKLFREIVEKTYGKSLKLFFRKYVLGGKLPPYKKYLNLLKK